MLNIDELNNEVEKLSGIFFKEINKNSNFQSRIDAPESILKVNEPTVILQNDVDVFNLNPPTFKVSAEDSTEQQIIVRAELDKNLTMKKLRLPILMKKMAEEINEKSLIKSNEAHNGTFISFKIGNQPYIRTLENGNFELRAYSYIKVPNNRINPTKDDN